jgi:hypothetical protein
MALGRWRGKPAHDREQPRRHSPDHPRVKRVVVSRPAGQRGGRAHRHRARDHDGATNIVFIGSPLRRAPCARRCAMPSARRYPTGDGLLRRRSPVKRVGAPGPLAVCGTRQRLKTPSAVDTALTLLKRPPPGCVRPAGVVAADAEHQRQPRGEEDRPGGRMRMTARVDPVMSAAPSSSIAAVTADARRHGCRHTADPAISTQRRAPAHIELPSRPTSLASQPGPAPGWYHCYLRTSGGRQMVAGSFHVGRGGGAWVSQPSLPPRELTGARLVGPGGTEIASATFT